MVIFQSFLGIAYVSGESMQPAYENGNVIIFQKLAAPRKGDVVTAYIDEMDCVVVKRVLGISGDHIKCTQEGVYVNGEHMKNIDMGENDGFEITVPANHYFLMGDNGAESLDSRKFGCIGKSSIQGTVIGKLF